MIRLIQWFLLNNTRQEQGQPGCTYYCSTQSCSSCSCVGLLNSEVYYQYGSGVENLLLVCPGQCVCVWGGGEIRRDAHVLEMDYYTSKTLDWCLCSKYPYHCCRPCSSSCPLCQRALHQNYSMYRKGFEKYSAHSGMVCGGKLRLW